MIGGRNFDESHFNRATQAKRQPGSAFKPFVYAAALEAGFTPASVIDNLDDPIWTPQGNWVPEDEHLESSSMTLRTALRTSSNRAAVQLLQLVGIDRTVEFRHQASGGNGAQRSVARARIGRGHAPVDDACVRGVCRRRAGAAVGSHPACRGSRRQGAVQAKDEPVQAIQESTAFLMANMLADVVNAGTAYRARSEGFTLPAAGKTGTTNDYVDAWFVGFTPRLVTGVWVGFDRPQTIVRNGYGGELAVPLWAHFMKEATAGDKPDWFERPENIVGRGSLPPVRPAASDRTATTSRPCRRLARSSGARYVATEYFVREARTPDTQCQHPPLLSARRPDRRRRTRTPEPPPPPPAQPIDNHATVGPVARADQWRRVERRGTEAGRGKAQRRKKEARFLRRGCSAADATKRQDKDKEKREGARETKLRSGEARSLALRYVIYRSPLADSECPDPVEGQGRLRSALQIQQKQTGQPRP